MSEDSFEIRILDDPADMVAVVTVFQQVWGTVLPIVGVELLRAISHAGGYVASVTDSGNIIGASFGFLARHRGQSALHSHITGILPGVQHSGVGRAMKQHQRAWAAEQDLEWVTWTFDPLVRRNAWFNLEVLKAEVAEYLVDFYGPMEDSMNSNDVSDRILIAWRAAAATAPEQAVPSGPTIEVATPDDIHALRRTDPAEAMRWRLQLRDQLGGRLSAGGTVTGFTRDGSYLVAGGS